MANDLSKVMPVLFAQGLPTLRNTSVMTRAVNKSYGADAKEKGESINIPIASAVTTTDVVPGAYANEAGDTKPTTISLPLDQWKEAAFYLTEKEVAAAMNGIIPMQLKAAAASLANEVNAHIFSKAKAVANFTGTPGTTPFASLNDAVNARTILGRNQAPQNDRFMVIDPVAEGSALLLSNFNQAHQSADSGVITKGDLGEKLGFYWLMDQMVPTHISTALTAGSPTVNGAHAAGATTVSIAKPTNASPLVRGDILTFAGDAQTYVVTADVVLGVGNTNVSIYPALKVSKSGGQAVSLAGSHAMNLAFQKEAFAFASRPLSNTQVGSGADNEFSIVDPVSGLSMRLTYRQEHHRTRFAFDMLYGALCVRPDLAVRVAG